MIHIKDLPGFLHPEKIPEDLDGVDSPDPQHDRISVLMAGKDGPPSRKHPRRKDQTSAAVGESKKTGSRIQSNSGSACRNGTSTGAIRL